MKNFLKMSLLVMLLTGAVEMRAPEGQAPVPGHVVEGHVVDGARPGEAHEGEVMAIDGQATAAGKVAEHNAAMIKTMNSVIPGGVKIAAPMGGGISFGDGAAAKPAAASAPVSGKGGISLGLGKPSINSDGSSVKINPNNSTEETHIADDGSKVIVHRDADGTIQKAVITHKAPTYSLRNVTDSLRITAPKTTTIEPSLGNHKATTVDSGLFGDNSFKDLDTPGTTITEIKFDAQTGQKISTTNISNDYRMPTFTGMKTGITVTDTDHISLTEATTKIENVTSVGLFGPTRPLSRVETTTRANVQEDGSKKLLTTQKKSLTASLSPFSRDYTETTKITDHVNNTVETTGGGEIDSDHS